MLLDFIETPILRKINLIQLLFYSNQQSVDSLALKLDCATLTLMEDVNYLRNELDINIEIIQDDHTEMLMLHDSSESFHDTLQKIYATSYFLQFFTYFFDENSGRFSDFIAANHISTATGYRIRKDIKDFIESVGLTVKNNTLAGRGLLIRFLAIELHRNFSVKLLPEDPEINAKAQEILNEMEQILHVHFSHQERILFSLLMQTSCHNLYNKDGLGLSQAHLNSIYSDIYPKQLPQLLKDNFSQYWHHQKEELEFCILAFIAINSHVFDSAVPSEILATNKKAFHEHPEVKRLINLFYDSFTINEKLLDYFYTSLYLFIRDSAFDLQPVMLNHLQLSEPNTVAYRRIQQILTEWNIYGIRFNPYHIITLYNRLAPMLSLSLYQNIIIVSDKPIDANFVSDYIRLLTGPKSKILIENHIPQDYPLLNDEQSIFVIDKSSDIALPTELMNNCFYTTFPVGNTQIFYLLNKLNLI